MKRLVAYVSEIGPQEASAAGLDMQIDNGPVPDLPATPQSLRIESRISEIQLTRILAVLVESAASSNAATMRREVVRQQIETAGPEATDLLRRVLEGIERELIEQVLAQCNGVQVRAAARLGIDRNSLRTRVRALQLNRSPTVQPTV